MEEDKIVKKRRRHKAPIIKTRVLFGDPLQNILFEYRNLTRISIKDLLGLRTVCKHWSISILYIPNSVWEYSVKKGFSHNKFTIEERIQLLRHYNAKGWKILPNRSEHRIIKTITGQLYIIKTIRDLKPPKKLLY